MPDSTDHVFTRNIPLADLRAGDHCRVRVLIQKSSRFQNNPRFHTRNATIISEHGPLLQVQLRGKRRVAVARNEVQEVWGYRPKAPPLVP